MALPQGLNTGSTELGSKGCSVRLESPGWPLPREEASLQ